MTILSPEVLDFQKDILPLKGKLRFPLTHDYMFTAAFRRNTYALKGFLAAKLGRDPNDITSLEVMNPMETGSSVEDKDIILDVKVRLNHLVIIDIEMQVAHYDYLPDRFLYQLCRIYSNSLPKGRDYGVLPPVIHIAIMDKDLFPNGDIRNTGDFLSEYYLTNIKNKHIYTGNFHLEVVSLKYLNNAIDKDDPNGIYRWARLFKSTTWEELIMIAKNNEYMESIATSVCALCHDPKFVAECERRFLNEVEYNSRMAEADRKGMERGMARGMARGLEQGIKQGIEQGIEQGIKQGIEQGVEQGEKQGIEQGIKALILNNLEDGHSAEKILDRLIRHFSLSKEKAKAYYDRYACEAEFLGN